MSQEMLPEDTFTRPRGRWKEKIQIRHLLSDEDLPLDQLKEKGKQIAAILRGSRLFDDDGVIMEFAEGLFDDLDDFNYTLSKMYDECDRARIWVE